MLSKNDLATIRASLRYWHDEIVPGGLLTAGPYFDLPSTSLLTASETMRLLHRFDDEAVRYLKLLHDKPVSALRLSRPATDGRAHWVTVINGIQPPEAG